MLVQVVLHNQVINVHLEQMQGKVLDKLGREDREYVRTQIKDCVEPIINKFNDMYGERE